MATRAEWTTGFARLAREDLRTFGRLQQNAMADVPDCQKLQFLQMACEKLVKAHLYRHGSLGESDRKSHTVIRKHLPKILQSHAIRLNWGEPRIREMLRTVKHLAQEIEYLSPTAVRDGTRQDNCEYPWEDHSGKLQVPLDWSFAPLQLLTAPGGRAVLKLVAGAIEDLLV